jgi:HK97 family phage portal protein
MNIFRRIARKILIGSEDATISALFPDRVERTGSIVKSKTEYLTLNQISLYLNRAIQKRAEKVGEIQFTLKQGDKVIERNGILDLLNKPNNKFTGTQFWELCQKYLDLTGEVFILKESGAEIFSDTQIKALHVLRSDMVTPNFNQYGDVVNFTYKLGGQEIIYDEKEVIYVYRPDPMNPLRGESLIRAGIREIETGNQLVEYQDAILRNGGKIEGVFKFKNAINASQLTELQKQYEEKYAEAKKAGRPLFLGGDSEYMRVGLDPVELGYLESKKVTLDDISILTGVPRAVLAVTSGETFSNADAALTIFLRETIRPNLSFWATALDWKLVPDQYDLGYIDPTPENREELRKDLETANTISAISINEKREALGYERVEIDGADDIFIPFSWTRLGEESAGGSTEPSSKSYDHPLRDPDMRRKWGQIQVKRMDKRETALMKEMRDYFDGQRDRLVESVDNQKQFKKKDIIDEIFNRNLELELAKNTVLPLLEKFLRDSGNEAFSLLGTSKFNFVITSEMQSWLDKRVNLFAGEINKTTYEKLKDQFKQSFENGENRKDLIKRIENVYEGFDEKRARTIARTEVHGVTSKGTMEGYQQAGVPIKIWVTVGDKQVRDSHAKLDGMEVPINQPFPNRLQFPGDPAGPADETVNCRCQI